MQAARSSLQRKKTPGVFEAEDYISIKHLTRPQTLPRLYDGEMLKRAGSQPHMHLPIASPSKAYTSLSSQHMNSVRTVPDYLDKSLNTYRSASMTGRKPTVEYLQTQTYDARSLSLPIEADQEWSPADMKSIEAAKAKNKEIQSKSQETRVTPTQTLLANKPEFTLLSEILVAFESVASTVRHIPSSRSVPGSWQPADSLLCPTCTTCKRSF